MGPATATMVLQAVSDDIPFMSDEAMLQVYNGDKTKLKYDLKTCEVFINKIDEVVKQSKHVELTEGRVVALDEHHEMINCGWTTPTPWNTHREESEDQLRQRIQVMVDQLKDVKNSVFQLHDPPYGSGLDEAPELTKDLRPAFAGRSLVPVGSHAVLEMIERYQPVLSLHGHVHEGKGTRIYKRTLCINPGSMYEQGMLHGAVVELKPNKVGTYILTTG